MELKEFSLGQYDGTDYVVKGNASRRFARLGEYATHLFQQLREKKHPLFLLFPEQGIMTTAHAREVFGLLKTLGELEIIEKAKKSEAKSAEAIGKVELKPNIAITMLQRWTRLTAKLPPMLWSLGIPFMAAIGMASYIPLYRLVISSGQTGEISFFQLCMMLYLGINLAFIWRGLVRAAFLRSLGREVVEARLQRWGLFLTLAVSGKDIWLEGVYSRLAMTFLSAIAPLAVAGIFTELSFLTSFPPLMGFLCSFPFIVASLLLLCPLHNSDGFELFQVFSLPKEMQMDINTCLRSQTFLKAPKRWVIFALFTLVWTMIWADLWRSLGELLVPQLLDQIYINADPGLTFLYQAVRGCVYLILCYPIIAMAFRLLNLFLQQRLAIAKIKKIDKQPLTYQEQNAALSRIPLFVSLSEPDAQELFRQMETRFFNDGEKLVKQGEIGTEFFILVRGNAYAQYTDSKGKVMLVGHIQEGDAFGEVALIDDVPRTASVISDGGCYAVILKKSSFQSFVEKTSSSEKVKQLIRLTSFFRKHPLFRRLGGIELLKVIESLQYEALGPRESISESALQENFFMVYSGKVKFDTGDDRTDFFLNPEDAFGFHPLAVHGMQGTLTSQEGAGILRIPKAAFLEHIWDYFLNREEMLC